MIKITNTVVSNFTFHTLGCVPDCLECNTCKRTYHNDEYLDLIENTSVVTCVDCKGKAFVVNPK